METSLASYDDVPYPGDPIAAMHPDRLAALARLHGLAAASPARCRVLELGCCDGGNLIPLALTYPASHFVGVDLSRRQIATGQAEIAALGLTNLELWHADIRDIGPARGTFDYVLCHGVYSWVPAEVQRKILHIAREQLAPAGVAYVAYNTYPGWHQAGTVREWLLRAVAGEANRARRLARARLALDALIRATEPDLSPHGRQLHTLADELRQRPDHYLAHEYLEDCNEPLWFREFVTRAETAGLRFLAEANLATMEVSFFPPATRQTLADLAPDRLTREQCLDVLRNRTFRQSLLCQREAIIKEQPDALALLDLSVSSEARLTSPRTPGATTFARADGNSLTTTDSELVAVLTALETAYPAAVAVRDLPAIAPDLATRLLNCVTRGFVTAHVAPAPAAAAAGERPLVNPWTRRQAERGIRVTDLRHQLVELDETERLLVPLLDGRTPRSRLMALLEQELIAGRLAFTDGGLPEGAALQAALAEIVEVVLRNLARQALITAASS